jgi:hypothetical protein
MAPLKALLQDFEEDIFINYDHDDNQALMDDDPGWVDTMHDALARRLTQLVGEKPRIFRDILMRGDQPLPSTIGDKLERTASLLPILSPSYVKSRWCKDELNLFYRGAANNGGIKINNRSRIFKVVKTPICDDPAVDPLAGSDLPQELRDLMRESLGYEFYEFDRAGKLHEFWPKLGPEYRQKFLAKLEDLAQDIKKFIESQQFARADTNTVNKIYLAETTPELSEDRNQIKRNLLQHNFQILPDENLPNDPVAFDRKVNGYLAQSVISIHLIGSDHTVTADDEKLRSHMNLQHQVAIERVRKQHELAMNRGDNDPDYLRLIWMPAGLSGQAPSYQEFIDYLKNDPGVYENAEVLCGANLEDLKTIIQRKLKLSQDESSTGGKRKRVYLICDKQDMEAASPIQTSLKLLEYDVILPFKKGGEVVSGHKENLRLCDAVLIFYGSANTMEWKLKELRKIDVFRDRPLLAQAIYVAGPANDQKRAFATDEALVMKNFGEFSPESLNPFLSKIETASKGAPA